MLDREPFLQAIAADPAADLPWQVFADHLDDRGAGQLAELVRLELRYHRSLRTDRVPTLIAYLGHRSRLLDALPPGDYSAETVRLLFRPPVAEMPSHQLLDPDGLRRVACERFPHWYLASATKVVGDRLTDPAAIETLLRSPVTAGVTRLDLSGRVEHLGTSHDDRLEIGLIDFEYRPVVGTRVVEHLCGLREARRLVALDLSRNELDNDAVRAVLRSTNLIRLTELSIQDGNTRVKGRLWGELLERFGPGVVR